MKVENFQKITQTTFNFLNCKCCNRRLYLIKSKDYFSKVKNVFSFFGLLDVIFITQILILILIILILMKFDELISCIFRMVIDSVDPLNISVSFAVQDAPCSQNQIKNPFVSMFLLSNRTK